LSLGGVKWRIGDWGARGYVLGAMILHVLTDLDNLSGFGVGLKKRLVNDVLFSPVPTQMR